MARPPLRLRHDKRGVVAIEFALIAPFLIVLLMGLFEVVSLVRVSLKLSHAANELAKLVAQTPAADPNSATPPNVTGGRSGTLGDYCTGAGYALIPYGATPLAAQIVSLTSPGGGAPTVDWESDNSCPTAATTSFGGAAVSKASSYALTPNAKDSTIGVQVSYVYKPILSYVLGSTLTLTQVTFSRPRGGTNITCSTC